MDCLCSAHPLRLFIRNISRIELISSARSAPRHSIRSLNRQSRYSTYEAIASAATKDVQRDAQETGQKSRTAHIIDEAILEINPENLDALAQEAESSSPGLNTPIAPSISEKKEPSFRISRTTKDERPRWHAKEQEHLSDLPPSPKDDVLTRKPLSNREREPWQVRKAALKEKLGDAPWQPRKRLSPDALEGIRAIHSQFPDQYTTPVLAEKFKVSPEAIRRILKGKWTPNEEEEEERKRRWFKRGQSVWKRYNELGMHPPKKWRQLGIGRLDTPRPRGLTVLKTTPPRAPVGRGGGDGDDGVSGTIL